MRFTRRSAFAVSTGIVMLASLASAQQYHSNDLTPPLLTGAKLTSASQGKQVGSGANSHAYLMKGNALTATDLNPPGYSQSWATASDDASECGYGWGLLGFRGVKWSGTAASYTELQPPSGYNASYCVGIDNGQQVGFAENLIYSVTLSHAMYWNGASTPVDLHPSTAWLYSRATGIKGGEQVGYVSQVAYPYYDSILSYHTTSHAYRWTGDATTGVDLHPAQFDASEALATNGTQQGGWGYSVLGTSHLHALLWSGTATSAVDLSPAGFTDTKITALNATQQVGEGCVGTVRHALLWTGTADSVVDLNQYLPAGYTHAVATGIDANGNAVGYAYNGNYPAGSIFTIPTGAIAVVFAPGQAPPASLAAVTLSATTASPGDVLQATVTLGGAAPAGGVSISFLSTNVALAATPASLVIPEGQSSATFSLPLGGLGILAPQSVKIYSTDGTVSSAAGVTLNPIVKLSSITANPVEGGFTSYGTVILNIPAQVGGVTVSLTSGDPSLVTVPVTLTVPQFYQSLSYTIATVPVTVATSVPITATYNGQTLTTQVSLSPAPVISVTGVTLTPVVGGQSVTGTVSLNTFPRALEGATVTLVSSDNSVKVPATLLIPKGAASGLFTGTTSVVSSIKTVSITASSNGSSITGTFSVNPVPTVTIISADYLLDTQLFKVQADTTFANSVLSFGTDPKAGPLGLMQIEAGVWKGAMSLATAPKQATVWNSNGGQATIAVTVKTGTGGNSTGGGGNTGGGGGGSTSSTFKLTIVTSGKGSVSTSCASGVPCTSPYASGTSVTLTATPAAGSPWVGWSGACTGTATSCTVVMNKDTSVTANFK